MLQFNGFQDPAQRLSNSFVDPSMLNAHSNSFMNGNVQYPQLAQRPMQPSSFYGQPGTTVDPRSLHGQQQQMQTAQPQALRQQPGQALPGKSKLLKVLISY